MSTDNSSYFMVEISDDAIAAGRTDLTAAVSVDVTVAAMGDRTPESIWQYASVEAECCAWEIIRQQLALGTAGKKLVIRLAIEDI